MGSFWKKTLWTVLLCFIGALAISATSGFAQQVTHLRLFDPTYVDHDLPAIPHEGGVCSFPVRYHFIRANIYNQIFLDANGDLIKLLFEGNAVVELINLDTQQSVVRNISGPGKWDPATRIVDMSGPWINDYAYDDPYWASTIVGLWYHTGHLVVDVSGPVPQISKHIGKWENICETLAPH